VPIERGRTVALTATLGAALVTGVAGGSAAAAATHQSAPALPSATLQHSSDLQATGPAPSVPATTGVAFAPALRPAGASDGVRLKERPKPPTATVTTPGEAATGGAAWVNPNPTARVTSCFGPRWGRMHEGVDLAATDGTPIVAAGAGIVVRAGVAEGYGNAILIDHGNGYLTHYGHLSVIGVTVGQHVAAGQPIGNEGSTGHTTGPHLHFEVHRGYYQNPIEPTEWMHEHGVDIPGCVPLT